MVGYHLGSSVVNKNALSHYSPFWLPHEPLRFHPFTDQPKFFTPIRAEQRGSDVIGLTVVDTSDRLQDSINAEKLILAFLNLEGFSNLIELIKSGSNNCGLGPTENRLRRSIVKLFEKKELTPSLARLISFSLRDSLSEPSSFARRVLNSFGSSMVYGLRVYVPLHEARLHPQSKTSELLVRLGSWILLERWSEEHLEEVEKAIKNSDKVGVFKIPEGRFVPEHVTLASSKLGNEFSEPVLPFSVLVANFLSSKNGIIDIQSLKSLARALLIVSVYPEMIDGVFVEIFGVAFPLPMVLSSLKLHQFLPKDIRGELAKVFNGWSDLSASVVYPSCKENEDLARAKFELGKTLFWGINENSNQDGVTFFQGLDTDLCLVSERQAEGLGVEELKFSLSCSNKQLRNKDLRAKKAVISFMSYLLLAIKHLLPEEHVWRNQRWTVEYEEFAIEIL